MPPAARVTDMHTCPMFTGPVPHVGGPILPPGAPTVLIDFLPAATVTSMATCVGPPDVIVKGSAGVFINFLPAARMGDLTAHGGVIVLGAPNVIIGEIGSPSPGAAGNAGVVAGLAMSGAMAAMRPVASVYGVPATGSTASGASIVPVAYTPPNRRVAEDAVLCKAICFCNQNPDRSSSGAKLKQQCVSSNLKAADQALGGRSPLKPEVSYNVATTPPTLLPASPVPDDPDLPGNTGPGYQRRRPDVVVVDDVSKPPTADNISRIVEIKFPGDALRPGQLAAYQKIAGGPDKVSVMGPADCGCGGDPEDPATVPSTGKVGFFAALLAALLVLLKLLAGAAESGLVPV